MLLRSLLLAAAPALALGLASSPAAAAPAPSANPPAKVRVHVDTDFFGFTHFNPESSDRPEANVNTLGFGIGRLSLLDGGAALFDRSLLSVGVGGVILGGRAVVGARVAFVVDGFLRDGGNDTALGGRLVPYFDYMFDPAGRVRPYIGAHFGLGGGAVTSEEEFGGATTRSRASVLYPIVGAHGGVHVFLVERVSLDAGLAFDYAAPFGKAAQIEPTPPPDTDEPGFEQVGNVLNVAVTLGLSAWF